MKGIARSVGCTGQVGIEKDQQPVAQKSDKSPELGDRAAHVTLGWDAADRSGERVGGGATHSVFLNVKAR